MGSARHDADASTPEHRLLHPTSDNEDTRKANIRDWLFSIGIGRVETEYPTGAGPADIYLPNRRVIIETKRKGKAVPDMPAGARLDETCMEQLARYVSAERLREQRALDEDDNRDLPWMGILTDSQAWHVWVWSDTGPEYADGWNGRRLDRPGAERLSKLLQRTVGREWAPGDPTGLFDGHLSSLVELYGRRRGERDVVTQRELWHRQLRMSGNQPAADHADRLFILHTLLISVSTKISEMYGNADTRYGFASWVKGTPWLDGLNATIRRYNWRQQTGDVLRALYMGLVDKADRHIYGEYYTPDWLAEWLCGEVIDDAYIDGWVRTGKGGGVMDPACGSGTFLYHAVRRIVESEPVRAATMSSRDLTDMVVSMVHGVDIHPVAVAMAKANVLRALPDRPGVPLHIYQGDSLQISRNVDDDAQQRIDELESDVFTVVSRRGAEIRFPLEFIAGEGFDGKMHRFARAASLGNPFPPGLDGGMADGRRSMLHRAFRTLTGVCRDEGNDVWAWYVINQAGIYMLKGRIARVVANPPWVRISNIQDPARKAETESLAKDLGLWAGANNATGFNTAALFAVQCGRLYGAPGMVSGWVLPDAAMRGGNWAAYSKKVDPPAVYDLGGLPFPKHSGACVNMLGVPRREPQRMVLNGGKERPGQREGWESVRQRVRMEPVVRDVPKKSMWFDGRRPIARQGAILTPSCLVILDSYSVRGGRRIWHDGQVTARSVARQVVQRGGAAVMGAPGVVRQGRPAAVCAGDAQERDNTDRRLRGVSAGQGRHQVVARRD